jgi:hypothetical protein
VGEGVRRKHDINRVAFKITEFAKWRIGKLGRDVLISNSEASASTSPTQISSLPYCHTSNQIGASDCVLAV